MRNDNDRAKRERAIRAKYQNILASQLVAPHPMVDTYSTE